MTLTEAEDEQNHLKVFLNFLGLKKHQSKEKKDILVKHYTLCVCNLDAEEGDSGFNVRQNHFIF